ncbi:hypothetical protein OF83DRAFT_1158564 [Amylostereum chailletii]|nr:hypothetical protein OF83DRAFT_1158564 [Amylostereum chailletii]
MRIDRKTLSHPPPQWQAPPLRTPRVLVGPRLSSSAGAGRARLHAVHSERGCSLCASASASPSADTYIRTYIHTDPRLPRPPSAPLLPSPRRPPPPIDVAHRRTILSGLARTVDMGEGGGRGRKTLSPRGVPSTDHTGECRLASRTWLWISSTSTYTVDHRPGAASRRMHLAGGTGVPRSWLRTVMGAPPCTIARARRRVRPLPPPFAFPIPNHPFALPPRLALACSPSEQARRRTRPGSEETPAGCPETVAQRRSPTMHVPVRVQPHALLRDPRAH